MNIEKLEQYKKDLQLQREEAYKQLLMLDGAIQLAIQLIEESQKVGAVLSAPTESEKDVEKLQVVQQNNATSLSKGRAKTKNDRRRD